MLAGSPLPEPDPLPELLPDSLSEEWPLERESMSEVGDELQALDASVVSVASARVCLVRFMLKTWPARRVPSVALRSCCAAQVCITRESLLTRYADRRVMHARPTQGMRRRRILRPARGYC